MQQNHTSKQGDRQKIPKMLDHFKKLLCPSAFQVLLFLASRAKYTRMRDRCQRKISGDAVRCTRTGQAISSHSSMYADSAHSCAEIAVSHHGGWEGNYRPTAVSATVGGKGVLVKFCLHHGLLLRYDRPRVWR